MFTDCCWPSLIVSTCTTGQVELLKTALNFIMGVDECTKIVRTEIPTALNEIKLP